MKLFYDDKSTISIVHNSIQHDRIKHIDIERHFIKENLDSGLISTTYISYGNQLTNGLTNGLPLDDSTNLLANIEWLISIYQFEEECCKY